MHFPRVDTTSTSCMRLSPTVDWYEPLRPEGSDGDGLKFSGIHEMVQFLFESSTL